MKLKKYYDEPDNKYNIVSVSIFKLEKGYKSGRVYYNGLKALVDFLPKVLPDFYLRVYFDRSIVKPKHKDERINQEIKELWKPLFDRMKSLGHIQLVRYKVPELLAKDPIYHKGLLGTMFRFLPLFDYGTNNSEHVIITDLDFEYGDYKIKTMKKIYDKFVESKSEFHFKTRECYYTLDRIINVEKQLPKELVPTHNIRIIASLIISKIKFPQAVFEEFFSCLSNINRKECHYLLPFVETQNKLIKGTGYGKVTETEIVIPIYGIDEFFLNINLLKYIEHNKIPFSYTILQEDQATLFYEMYLRNDKYKVVKPEYINFFKEIMGKYYRQDLSFHRNYDFFDRVMYPQKDKKVKNGNHILEYFKENIRKIFLKFKKEGGYQKIGLKEEELDCTLDIQGSYPKWLVMFDYPTD